MSKKSPFLKSDKTSGGPESQKILSFLTWKAWAANFHIGFMTNASKSMWQAKELKTIKLLSTLPPCRVSKKPTFVRSVQRFTYYELYEGELRSLMPNLPKTENERSGVL